MKHITLILLILAALASQAFSAESNAEQEALAVLQDAAAAPAAKDAALLQLKQIGTAKSVPTLASLLSDEDRWQAALDALETMPCAEAGKALCAALRSTTGKTKAAVAHALGERRERHSLPALVILLTDNDAAVAKASAQALARIGGDDALAALLKARRQAPAPLQRAFADALLECAAHDRNRAPAIYKELSSLKEPDAVRAAAFRGMVLASGDRGVALVCDALKGNDAVAQVAAMPLVRELSGGTATKQFVAVLAVAKPMAQAALLDALSQRGDAAAAPAVAALARSPEATVRVAAINALGELGGATDVPTLAEALAGADAERDAARLSLQRLHRGNISGALVAHIEKSQPVIQIELIQTLARRGEKTAVPSLLKLAQADDAKVSVAAIRALQELATETQADALLDLIVRGKPEATHEAAESALVAVAARAANREAIVEMALKAMQGADVSARCAMLQTAGRIGGPKSLAALQGSAKDPCEEIRDTAVRAMADHAGVEALPHLLALSREASSATHRILALRGYWRLVGQAEKQPAHERLKLCADGLAAAQRPDEKRLGLVELGKVALPAALELAEKCGTDPAVKAEAELAARQIRSRIAGPAQKPKVGAAPKPGSPFIRDWLVCGPYSQPGVTGALKVFEIAFAPEKSGEKVEWKPVPKGDRVNLAGLFPDKNDCAAYLKTEIVSPQDCDATLLLGSDDGVKAWLNGAVVHSKNVDRGCVADQDSAPIKLKKGKNVLMLKVTQGGGGWMACARIGRAGAASAAHAAPPAGPPPKPSVLPKRDAFKKLRLSGEFYAEGAYYGDFNRDGKMDVVAGPFWFEGPDFQKRHEYRPAKTFDPKGYSDNFLTFTGDFNGDGWTDILCVTFPGKEAFWYENPAGKDAPWKQHVAYPNVGNESPVWGDINGDGRPELIFCNDGYLGYATPNPSKPDEPWVFHAVSKQDKRYFRFTHGIGFGDINGDGRADAVEAAGWWEQPAKETPGQPWTFHPQQFAQAGAQMLVTDVDGDGLADIITAWHCHHYGLVWWKQIKDARGAITWRQNVILPPTPDLNSSAFRVSQMHALDLVDMNGDGLKDILTGKRFWAHGPTGDKEPDAPAVVFWLELRRDGKGGATFVPHLIDEDSGVGTQVAATDLNGDGHPDVIVGNKKGIFIHLSQPAGGKRAMKPR
jgi:HEAT repeat protein